MKRIALLLVILTFSLSSQAQVHIDTETIDSGEPIYFSDWKYHPGDDPAWADPDFDDSDWETVDARLPKDNLPTSGWDRIGWFRIHITIDDALVGKTLALLTSQWGASEIYINGEKWFSYGKVNVNADYATAYVMPFRKNPSGFMRIPDGEIIMVGNGSLFIAVRYSNHHISHLINLGNTPGIEIGLQKYSVWLNAKNSFNRYVQQNRITLPAIGLLMFVFYLALYFRIPRFKENYYFSIYMLFLFLNMFFSFSKFEMHNIYAWFTCIYVSYASSKLQVIVFLLFLYSVFSIKTPKYYWFFVLYIVYSITFHAGTNQDPIISILLILETIHILIISSAIQRKGLWLLRMGIIVFTFSSSIIMFGFITEAIGSHNFLLYVLTFGIYFFLVTMNIYLANQFANVFYESEALNEELEDRVQTRTVELEKANKKLRELDKMKSEFVSQASHDLRTPLTGIKGSMDNLVLGIAGALNEKQSKIVNRALNSITRLGNLIDDVLDLNRIESGRMAIEKSQFDISQSVKSILDEELPAAQQKNITLNASGLDQPCTINADAGKIERVIGELIGNAIKYTPNDGVVDVSLTQEEKQVLFAVKDNGIGMSQEDCNKIFERFYRVDAAKTKAKGSGLGLSIAKELVEMHGGSIKVDSELGKGTTFRMNLPVGV